MMTHCLHGGDNHGNNNGFTALGKTIGSPKTTETDADYVKEHQILKYFRKKLSCCLHAYRRHWPPLEYTVANQLTSNDADNIKGFSGVDLKTRINAACTPFAYVCYTSRLEIGANRNINLFK